MIRTGTLKITGTATLGGFSVGCYSDYSDGTTSQNAGTVTYVGSLSVTGQLINSAGRVWPLTSASDISSFVDAATGTVGIAFANAGSVVANQGSLTFNNGFTNAGVIPGAVNENGGQTVIVASKAGGAANDLIASGGGVAMRRGGAGAFTQHAGELHQTTAGGTTLVEGDVDGNGTADFQIALTGNLTLHAGDFVL